MSTTTEQTIDASTLTDNQLRKMMAGEEITTAAPAAAEEKPSEQPDETSSAQAGEEKPAGGEKPAAGSDPANPQEPKDEQGKDEQRGLNKRFRELTSEIRELKARLAEKEKPASTEAKSGVASPTAETKSAEDTPPAIPDLENFPGTFAEYQKALTQAIKDITAYELRQAKKTEAEATERKSAEERQRDQAKAWSEAEASAMTELPDYETIADSVNLPASAPGSQAVAQAIQNSEIGPKVLYHLGKNPAEVERITKLSPVQAVLAIGKIEAALTAPKTETKPAAKAPLPKPPVVPKGGTAAESIDLNSDSIDQETFNREVKKLLKR